MLLLEMINHLASIIEEVLISIFVEGMPFCLLFNLQLFDFEFTVAVVMAFNNHYCILSNVIIAYFRLE